MQLSMNISVLQVMSLLRRGCEKENNDQGLQSNAVNRNEGRQLPFGCDGQRNRLTERAASFALTSAAIVPSAHWVEWSSHASVVIYSLSFACSCRICIA